ncbi:phage tail sheath subtilisin-like domain-containing protein [Clostridium butyricum]|uniref:phage tail sheath subtilisin-like domain-containing protein n=1 Tax=Clostridium butyricum TaxID=1492 RepID=UPI00325B294A
MSDKIKIILKALTDSAVVRSTRGIVCLLLKDSIEGVKEYKNRKQVKDSYLGDNLKVINKCFIKYGAKSVKVACYESKPEEAFAKLDGVKFNYLACPEATTDEDKKAIADFIKEQREQNNILVHAVLHNYKADHEGIINFKNDEVIDSEGTNTGDAYCVDVACMVATLSIERSLTNLLVSDVKEATAIDDVETAIDNGELFLMYDHDMEGYVFSDGVNSKTTVKDGEKEVLKSIRVCEIFDMIRDDLKVSFKKSYKGKVSNSYNNRKLIRDGYNLYFKQLAKEGVLNPEEANICWLDVDATKDYLESKGIDTSEMADEEVLKRDIGKKIFLKARVYALDTVEELVFEINY